MVRLQSPTDKARTLRLVRERIKLLHFRSNVECLKIEAQVASCDENLQLLFLAKQQAALVAQFDIDNPDIADLFILRRQTATVAAT